MIFTEKQAAFIKTEIGIEVPANKEVTLSKEIHEKISLEAFYIEGEESSSDDDLSERGKIAVSIGDLFCKAKA